MLDRAEAASIAAGLGLTMEGFERTHCLRDGEALRLRRIDGLCSLWREGCTAWREKPRVCHVWPFPETALHDPQGFEEVRSSCPGIDPDATHSDYARAGLLVHEHLRGRAL